MNPLQRLLRFLSSFAIPNVSLYLVVGQVAAFGIETVARRNIEGMLLVPAYVVHGEWWRVFTFLFVPPETHPVFLAFAWYLFWMMGSSLEAQWGTARYNGFLLLGWALTVGLSFVAPYSIVSNAFLAGSVFLAFAWLAPNFELALFFVLPVKIKWLALVAWVFYGIALIKGPWPERLAVLAATGNFLAFFARDILDVVRRNRRRATHQARARREAASTAAEPRHRCKVCGKDSDTHPQLDFRYCSKCADDSCYCPDHIRDHEHVLPPEPPPPSAPSTSER
ncbi:hypothetical protein ASA1KI_11620 [Opitutales bacterium ASA1]|uniref:rhomboid family intramembrane serine protease n=1 Tax=Congregicoccus parvus TaxID=3081749 RepID=UPI002B2F18F7|nr:hypothetical protein ASA1KI_11620 [Opitutales bacterium ASA1]